MPISMTWSVPCNGLHVGEGWSSTHCTDDYSSPYKWDELPAAESTIGKVGDAGRGMGSAALVTMAVSILIAGAVLVTASPEPEVVRVGGRVLCQDCTQSWNEWVKGARPIKGCKVSVTCLDDRGRVVLYDSDETDDLGQYNIAVTKRIHGKELKTELCAVRLVSSPDPTCNVLTDFAGGRSGVKLGRPTWVYRNLIKHILPPFYCTIPSCEKPDIS